jgi:D-glycerate 3-kinase
MPVEPMPSLWPVSHSRLSSREAADVLARSRSRIEAWRSATTLDRGRVLDALARLHVPLAGWAAKLHERKRVPLVLGIAGAQGTGKSTLAALLAIVLADGLGLRALTLSLDDLYLTRTEREWRARELHPLLRTRGAPGTHDTELGERVLAQLCAARRGEQVAYPCFDKANDDRAPRQDWPVWEGPTDVVLFEGWCLGAQAQSDAQLIAPINALERDEDHDGRFRRYVNAQLAGPYHVLFARIDALVFLMAPDMASVRSWRGAQERELAARAHPNPAGIMNPQQLERFIQHFERITCSMLAQLPARAEVVLELGSDHDCKTVRVKS